MAKTFTFQAVSAGIDRNTVGWIYDFVTGSLSPLPTSIPTKSVFSTTNFNPLAVTSVLTVSTFDHELTGNFAVSRIGTSTHNGGFWTASYGESVNLANSTIRSIEPGSASGVFEDTVSINFGGLVPYNDVVGKTLGQLIGNGDTILGSAKADTLATSNFAELVRGGRGDDRLSTRGGIDRVFGDSGNDVLTGGDAIDRLDGGAGNDIFVLEDDLDLVADASGIDTITSTITRTLVWFPTIEKLTLLGSGSINGVGNLLANTLTGNLKANTLDGGAADDVLLGGAGNDILIGGLGLDTLTGGLGTDVFKFLYRTHSAGALVDVITDFDDGAPGERIDLQAIYGPKLAYIHDKAFTKAGQVRINDVVGGDVIVEVNTIGAAGADFAIRLKATTLVSMALNDFIL